MYIDAKQIGKKIYISEKLPDGSVNIRRENPVYNGYFVSEGGKSTGICGEPLQEFVENTYWDLKETREFYNAQGIRTFETDISPVWKCLEKLYPTDDAPPINISLFDIETDKGERGYSTIDDPYTEITANSIYNKWSDTAVTLVVPPPNLTVEQCERLLRGEISQDADGTIIDAPPADDFGVMLPDDGYFVVDDEKDLLILSIEMYEDADILSGWNSEFFDIPYFIHRVRIVLGGESIDDILCESGTKEAPVDPSDDSRFWLERMHRFPILPSLKWVNNYGKDSKTYQLHGRIHMDYLSVYKKFTFGERPSYKLDAILQAEIGQRKVSYTGDLAELRSKDFRRFVAYSRQDTMGLSHLDDKLKFLDLANAMAHASSIVIPDTLGTIQAVEGAIIKALHRTRGHKIFDNERIDKEYPIPGALVLVPVPQFITDYMASFDFNSLYPSLIRMLNLSPETIVGFIEPTDTIAEINRLMRGSGGKKGMTGAEAWAHFDDGTYEYQKVLEGTDDLLVMSDPITGEKQEIVASELRQMILDNNWVLTGFGLVLHRDQQGIIPMVLEQWYNERVSMKKKASTLFKAGQDATGEEAKRLLAESDFYNQSQNLKKLFLNSTYGTLLAVASRFFMVPLGASVTMSGKISLRAMTDRIEDFLSNGK